MGLQPETVRADLDARFAMTPIKAMLVVLYLLSINAALEELHFRAWLDGELSSRWGDAVGIIVSALAFAAMHVFIFAGGAGASPTALVLIFLALAVAGTCWSLLARRRGGIHAAWLSHGLTDATLLTWGLFWLGYF
jgi:membrane protease YdiL (CAAX protease family)